MGHYGKSRAGGRATTDPPREGATRAIIQVFERDFYDENSMLLGDFNDNPDDRSFNILETGDPTATGGPEEIDGPFLLNLTEPLAVAGHVSHSKGPVDIIGEQVSTPDPASRRRNNLARGTNQPTGAILFDQILIPVRMRGQYKAPMLSLHGAQDERVPVRPAEAFAESLQAKGMAVKVQIFPHAKRGIPIYEQYCEIYPSLEEAIL
jgi:hypothetical protein